MYSSLFTPRPTISTNIKHMVIVIASQTSGLFVQETFAAGIAHSVVITALSARAQ